MKLDNNTQYLLDRLQGALQSSWRPDTAYQGLTQAGNPAYAQCYPTARVVQFYLPQTEILQGVVWTGQSEETHFWNGLLSDDGWQHIDLSWQQFPSGSVVRRFEMLELERNVVSKRFDLLLRRVKDHLGPSNENGHPMSGHS